MRYMFYLHYAKLIEVNVKYSRRTIKFQHGADDIKRDAAQRETFFFAANWDIVQRGVSNS